MRIGVDCRLSGPTHAGIGRYIQNLIQYLPQLAPEVEWVYFFFDEDQAHAVLGDHQAPNITKVFAPIKHYSLAEQLQLPGIFAAQKLDLLHVPHFNIPIWYQGKLVVTIHDLLWHEYRGTQVTTLSPWKYWFKYWAYRLVATQAVTKAQRIFVPAQTIKNTLVKYYPTVEAAIVVTKEGVDRQLLNVASASSSTWPPELEAFLNKNQPFLIYVGSLYPHKNVRLVIDALPHLPEHRLVIVGSRTVFQQKVRAYAHHMGLQDRVLFVGYLTDEQLTKLEQRAQALVQPSLSEGFGLTGVEAMALGVPVLASDIPIFKEIYQDAAEYFNPHSVPEFVEAVQRLNTRDRSLVIARGHAVAQTYDWQKMAHQTLQEYYSVLKT